VNTGSKFALGALMLCLSACATVPETRKDTKLTGPEAGPLTSTSTTPKPGDAKTGAPKAATVKPEPAPVPQSLAGPERDFTRAVEVARSGELTIAETSLKALLARSPKLAPAWTNLGIVQERQGRFPDADRSYRQALALDADQEAAWDCLVRLSARTGRAPTLEAELREALTRQDSVARRTALALNLLLQRKHPAAVAEARRALQANEQHVPAMQVLAQVYAREGKYELASMVLANALAIDAKDASTLNALGLVHLGLKERPQALERFRQAAALRPDFAEARNNLGALLNEGEDYAGARVELEAAVRAAPDFATAHLNLGNAYRGEGDFPRALAEYERVLQLQPDTQDAYFNLAVLHLDLEPAGMDTLERLQKAAAFLGQYQAKGGTDERTAQYIKDAQKGIDRETRRRERERKEGLKKAAEAASAAKPPEATPTPAPPPGPPALRPGASGKVSSDVR
jgi:Tfp pilus assembly protein PilF